MDDETRFNLIKKIEANPEISQRQLACELGVSLGKVNYCLKALIEVGLIKVHNFMRSDKKSNYVYLLTPAGAREKAEMTIRFLEKKQAQYDQLREEIRQLRDEVENKP